MEDRIEYMKNYYSNNKEKWKTYNKKGQRIKKKNLIFEKVYKNIILIFD
tara:strand:+ start:489 stop:635 length:147 start_codon:yes stop_codon:yes gene_type:complete